MSSSGSGGALDRSFFPLTSLQIGDLQSYLSRLSIFLTPNNQKLYFLVDNAPWLVDEDTRPAHLWQLMVTKSRKSPFANSRTRRKRSETGKTLKSSSASRQTQLSSSQRLRWYSVIDAAMQQKGVFHPVEKLKDTRVLNKELHRTLYGFIVFEVEWGNVRGINYLNELQTDTSMALEVKILRRWEFDSIEQASTSLSSWYPGNLFERHMLQEYLNSMCSKGDVFYDAPADSSSSFAENITFTEEIYTPPPPSGPYKKRRILREDEEESYTEVVSTPKSPISSSSSDDNEISNPSFEGTSYKNAFVLFKFNDPDLPFKLKDVIMSDLRLLTLLEYGLPSWVVFLQSYPLFCKIYRPWMCPLARFIYVLMSIVTVLIGFYDLYKNVPLMKATLSKIFGPFFDWIENWEMISRLQYLGTMLFLHNFEQAFVWALQATQSVRSFFTVLTRPVVGPVMEVVEFVLPIWKLLADGMKCIVSTMWVVLGTSWSVVTGVMEVIIWPFELVLATIVSIATCILSPLLWIIGEVLSFPFRAIFVLSDIISGTLVGMYYVLIESLSSILSMFQVASASKTTVTGVAYEASVLKTLWKDLFSKIFGTIRSILNGLVAFFSACNRHRLSIYNYILSLLEGPSHSEGTDTDSESSDDSSQYITPRNNSEGLRKQKTW